MMLSEDPDSTEKKVKYVSFRKERSAAVPIPEDEEEEFVSPMKDATNEPDSLRKEDHGDTKKVKLDLILKDTEHSMNKVNDLFS